MKKIIYLLPLLLGILACGGLSQASQNVSDVVIDAILTAMAQNNSQAITPQTIVTTTKIAQTLPSAILTTPSPAPTAVSQIDGSTTCSADWFFTFDDKYLSLAY